MAVVIDDGNNRLAAVMQFIQQQQQKRAEAERMRVQQEQFDRSFGLQERQVNSVVNANDDAVQRANAEAAVKNMMPRLQKFSAEGNYRAAEAEAASLLKAYEGSPYFEAIRHQVLPFVTPQQSAAMADTSASNVAKYTMDQTGLAAGGSEDAQAVNFTTKLATGEQLNAPAFGNQEQREFGPDALKSYVDIGAGRTANAGQRLQAQTQKDIAGMQIQAQKDAMTAGGAQVDFRDERALRSDFRKDFAPFIEADQNLAKAEAFARQKTGSADQMLLIAALSTIDGSVTREGEVALARKTGGLPERLRLMANNWKAGDLLDDNMRQRIIQAAREAHAMSQPRRKEIIDYYGQLSRDYGFSTERIVGLASDVPNVGDTRTVNGRTLYFDGRGWTDPPGGSRGTSGSW